MIEIVARPKYKGSNQIEWGINRNGVPAGRIWTFKARGEIHPYHVLFNDGTYEKFDIQKGAFNFAKAHND